MMIMMMSKMNEMMLWNGMEWNTSEWNEAKRNKTKFQSKVQ